jgi:hypothetical protein
MKHSEPSHPLRLLRTRRERPRRRSAAEKRDEIAPTELIELHPIPHLVGPRMA